jgi:hypothetical protein
MSAALLVSGCDFNQSTSIETIVSRAVEDVFAPPIPMKSFTYQGTSDEVIEIRKFIEALHREGIVAVSAFNLNQSGNALSVAMSITDSGRSQVVGTISGTGEEKAVFRLGRRSVIRFVGDRRAARSSDAIEEPRCKEFVVKEIPTELGQQMGIEPREFRARAIVRSDKFQNKDVVLNVEAGELGLDGWHDIAWLDEQRNIQRGLRKGIELTKNPCSY